ncbi:MAG TPA: hypothetical protein VMW25_00915 [Clostridia bacterium]|nr:hypothetical protein [Clostridia bacterium]
MLKIRKKFIISLFGIFITAVLALCILWQWDLKTGYSVKEYQKKEAEMLKRIEEEERRHPARIPQSVPIIKTNGNLTTISQDIYSNSTQKVKITFRNIDKQYVTNIDESPRYGITLSSDDISLQVDYGAYSGCHQLQGQVYNQFFEDYIYYSIFLNNEQDEKYSYFVSFSNIAHQTQPECNQCVFGSKAPCQDSNFDYGIPMNIRCYLKIASPNNLEKCLNLIKKMEIEK